MNKRFKYIYITGFNVNLNITNIKNITAVGYLGGGDLGNLSPLHRLNIICLRFSES